MTIVVAQVTIKSPTKATIWVAGQEEVVTFVNGSSSGPTTFSLMNGTQGGINQMNGFQDNIGANLVAVIATNIDPSIGNVSYTVPIDLGSGQYFIKQDPSSGVYPPDTPFFAIVNTEKIKSNSTESNYKQSGSVSGQPMISLLPMLLMGIL